jgi:hypothetical protein
MASLKPYRNILIGYARVSKLDQQDTRAQIKALKEAGCKRIFQESASAVGGIDLNLIVRDKRRSESQGLLSHPHKLHEERSRLDSTPLTGALLEDPVEDVSQVGCESRVAVVE